MTAIIAAAALALLAALLATALLLGSRWLRVEEDPRLAPLEAALPGVNCGACGQPGCHAFAEALLAGTAVPAGCTVSTSAGRERIARFLGVAVGTVRRQVARLACAGGRNVAPHRALYQGEATCSAAAAVGGGAKACRWGCLHFGDCERACGFDAIHMDAHGLPVVDEAACTACGDCVSACPKDLFRLAPADQAVWVNCNNPESGSGLVDICAVACTACGRCAQDAPEAIRMENNLPQVNARGANPTRSAIERCPTGAIVWIEGGRQQIGAAAIHPIRVRDLPVQPE